MSRQKQRSDRRRCQGTFSSHKHGNKWRGREEGQMEREEENSIKSSMWTRTSTVMYGERQEDKSRRERVWPTKPKRKKTRVETSPLFQEWIQEWIQEWMRDMSLKEEACESELCLRFRPKENTKGNHIPLHYIPFLEVYASSSFLPSSWLILPYQRWLMFMSSGLWMTPALNNMSSLCTKKKVCWSRGIRCWADRSNMEDVIDQQVLPVVSFFVSLHHRHVMFV